MKKTISAFTALLYIISATPVLSLENNDDNYFVVTAYYSPLPDQEHYLTGNYEDEMILNGRGIAGASGKKVFSGMLAAPKKYGFGTKIYLEGLGIGVVEDRGGAIVPAGKRGYSHDRIDVWMGHGDEGLRRALYWGKRKVYGYPVSQNKTTNLDYSIIPSPVWATKGLKKRVISKPKISVFDISLGKGSESEKVKELQNILGELGYLGKDSITGEYDTNTISAVYNFQYDNSVVASQYTPGAGSYGPKTRKQLQASYEKYLQEKREEEIFLNTLAEIREESLTKAEDHVVSLEKPVYGEISPRVRSLQKTLQRLGYFEYKDTAIFGVKTKNALISYQLDNDLIISAGDPGSGSLGPNTRAQFTRDLQEIYFLALLEENELTEKYLAHIGELDDAVTQNQDEDTQNEVGNIQVIHKI